MGIFIHGQGVSAIYWKDQPIIAVYTLGRCVWPNTSGSEEILSCYYNGYWIDAYPWTDDTPWTD